MSNRDLYKDEFGNFQEVEEELEDPTDGYEDDEQDHYEDEDETEDHFDSVDEEEYYDEDEEYLNERGGNEYDVDED